MDTGQSDWLIQRRSRRRGSAVARHGGGDSQEALIRVQLAVYQLTMTGPTETVTLQRSGRIRILSFRLRVDSLTPWKGRPAITATGTGQLLCELEAQMIDEAKVTPARVVAVRSKYAKQSERRVRT